ncbi:hypothetical protein ZIOFF_005716 [Zingiber officinale]|uniref:Protein kinase domain-containing protein n=1 Tax=Zingiber officinale TaxID=94328 RepID=A0A8J5M1S9_ZINOF|nr:hypothetical protein ZIOFF_005716 [Zingiber officinale]
MSDFGLAKMLGARKSHITTHMMDTFGYVALEDANSRCLNEKSDIYNFGVLLLKAITRRGPVDYRHPPNEVNLVDWLVEPKVVHQDIKSNNILTDGGPY